MAIIIRPVRDTDIPQMTELLNEIIKIGGTTAYLNELTIDDIASWVARGGDQASWHVAEENGAILGFQWAEPHDQLPPEAATAASFVRVGTVGKGIGTKLFEATTRTARELGFVWLNASIRSDNESGLSYYSKMGFKDWKVDPDAELSDGTVTGKHHKRFDL